MLDLLKFREGLPCAKRTFGIIIALGLLFSFVVYDFNSRNGYLLPAMLNLAAQPLPNMNYSQWDILYDKSNRVARPFQQSKQPPTLVQRTPKYSTQEKFNSKAKQDFSVNLDKDTRPKSYSDSSVDRRDKKTANSESSDQNISRNDDIFNVENSSTKAQNTAAITADNDFVKRLPNAIIIGVKKGGTRALLEILKIHPNVRACNSEVHFFDRDTNYKRGLTWYREKMPASYPQEITIEKSPAYFVTHKVPERVFNMSKTVKLLVVVRDPTRRAISDYTQSLEKKPDNYPFETFAVKDLEKGLVNTNWMKLKIGLYAKHLEKWLEYFPLNRILFVSGEELIHKPAKEIRRVETFLNLKHFITDSNFQYSESKGFYCLIGKRKSSDNSSDSKPRCMGKTKGRTHPIVNDSVMNLLHRYFRPHNLLFYKMVNRDFGWP